MSKERRFSGVGRAVSMEGQGQPGDPYLLSAGPLHRATCCHSARGRLRREGAQLPVLVPRCPGMGSLCPEE